MLEGKISRAVFWRIPKLPFCTKEVNNSATGEEKEQSQLGVVEVG